MKDNISSESPVQAPGVAPSKKQVLEAIKPLVEAGASCHWLRPKSKAPYAKQWSTAPVLDFASLAKIYRTNSNVGIRLGEPSKTAAGFIHLIDLDIRNGDLAPEAHAWLDEHVPNWRDLPRVLSGSGGESRHIYFLTEQPFSSKKVAKSEGFSMVWDETKGREVKKNDWEIELFGTGKQVVLPPSIHPDTGKPYVWEKPLDLRLAALLGVGPSIGAETIEGWGATAGSHTFDDDDLMVTVRNQPMGLDLATIENALNDLPDDWADDRDQWLTVGSALHHEFEGKPDGLAMWNTWSQQSDKFDEADQRRVWNSFGERKRPVRMATLIHVASANTGQETIAEDGRDVVAADYFSDLLGKPKEPGSGLVEQKTKLRLQRAKNGEPKSTLFNAIETLVAADARHGFGIRRNDMTLRDEYCGRVIREVDFGNIRVAIEKAGMHSVGSTLTYDAVRAVAERQSYHPVRDYLWGLTHDGTPRLDTWLSRYLQVEDTSYVRAVGRAFFIAMVARVMQPGCKHDHVLVLRGDQGLRKSTACSILGGAWYGDNMPSIRDGGREAGLYLRGHWVVELSELAPSRKAEAEELKAFMTRATDEIRAPYARAAEVVPRQCVFVGTTNEGAILRDMTGGRRFWPVTVERKIDTDALARDRDQLFAEALDAFQDGEAWHLSPEMEKQAAIVQEEAREEDPWESAIREHLSSEDIDGSRFESVRMDDLLENIGVSKGSQTMAMSRRAGAILRKLNWEKGQDSRGCKLWKRGSDAN